MIAIILTAWLLATAPAHGEFATFFNSPPNDLPVDTPFASDTQINIHAGHALRVGEIITLGEFRNPAKNTELNLYGGEVWAAHVYEGSSINVVGGHLGSGSLLDSRGRMFGGEVRSWSLFGKSHLEFSAGHAEHVETSGRSDSDAPDASRLVVTGGEITRLGANGNVIVEGGRIGDHSVFFSGGVIEVSGGAIGDHFEAGGVVVGSIPNSDEPVVVGRGGRVNLSGGSIGESMVLYGHRTLDFSGGTIGPGLQALDDSHVNIVGSSFYVNSVEVARPEDGRVVEVADRNVRLSGLLSDGRSFGFDLHTEPGRGDFFSPQATVTITFVPEVSALACLMVALGLCHPFRRRRTIC